MADHNAVTVLRTEATIAMRQLAAYRGEMLAGRGDERVLAAREQLCRDALRDLARAGGTVAVAA